MNHAAGTPSALRRHAGWVVVLVAVVAFIARDARLRRAATLDLSNRYGVTVDAPLRDPRSATGYAGGVRSLILPGRSLDGYHWIAQTQTMVADGAWRVRHVSYDNAPRGRDVHWAQPFRWWLVVLAGLDRAAFNSPWGVAIERASLLAGPLLLIVALATLIPWIARRFSPFAAAWSALIAVAGYPWYIDFVATYPDHHGMVNLCALVSVLGLLAASRATALVAGVAGGVGLWVSAATQIPVLLGVGLGGLAVIWLTGRMRQPVTWTARPELFRWWGGAGAVTSLAAYLVEYFPGHLGLRLEVNHPLYALAWLAGAEALHRLACVSSAPMGTSRSRHLTLAAIAAGIAALTPLTLLATRPASFTVTDPFLWRLHALFISEFQSLPRYLATGGLEWTKLALCLPLLVVPLAAVVVWDRRGALEDRAAVVLAGAPAVLGLGQTFLQIRWWGLELALLVPLVAVLLRAWSRATVGRLQIGLVLLLAPGLLGSAQLARQAVAPSDDEVRALAERDLAHWLRQRTGTTPATVLAAPTVATTLAFHGGHRVLGTLYWENREGLAATAAIYAAPSDAAAREMLRTRGVTHLVIVPWEGLEGAYVRLARGLAPEAALPADTFLVRLLKAGVPPPWLRQVPFPLPPHPSLERQQVRVYEVVAEQDEATATTNAATCALVLGQAGVTRSLLDRPELSGRLSADVLRAWLAWRAEDRAAFHRALQSATGRLAQAGELGLTEHIQLVALLAAAERIDLASQQLPLVLARLDDQALRELPAEPLAQLIALGDAAEAWTDPALRTRAVQLLPPRLRAR